MAIYTFDEVLKKTGAKPKDVQSMGVGSSQPQTQAKPGFFADAKEDIKQTLSNFKKTAQEGGQRTREALDAGIDSKQGLLRSAGQAFGLTAGGIAKEIGNVTVGAAKALMPQSWEDKAKGAIETVATPVVGAVVQIPAVKKFLADYENLDEKEKRDVDALFGISALATELATVPGVGSTAKKVAQKTVDVGMGAAKIIGDTGGGAGGALVNATEGVVNTVGKVAQGVKNLGTTIGEEVSRYPSRIATNVAERKAIRETIQQLPSRVAREAAQDGIEVADVKVLSNIPKAQKPAVKKLVTAVQRFSSGASKVRPEEVVGKPITQAIKQLNTQAGKVGQKLGEVAKNLGVVTKKELADPLFDVLKSVPGLNGLTVKNGVLNFKNTVLTTAETRADRKAIQSIFAQAIKGGTGESKHRLRQELFEILGGKKRALTNLTDTQEKAYQAIRTGLSNVLEGKNSTYKALSNQYRKIVQPLGDMRKFMKGVAGAEEDIMDMSAGLLARRLTSNASSNPQLRGILRAMDNALKTKGKTLLNIENLQDVYNILDKYYDIAAKTGLQGQVKAGVEKAAVSPLKYITGKTFELVEETSAVRQKALERLLSDILK